MLILYLTLAITAAFGGLLVYRYDMYEREPWYMVLAAIGLGYIVMMAMGPLEEWTLGRIVDGAWTPFHIGLVAGFHEEFAPFTVVALLALLVSGQFNDPLDGLIYGSLVGLGMAVEESVHFLRLWEVQGPLLPPTEIIRITGHIVMGGIAAFGIGLVRCRIRGGAIALVLGLATAMILHILWDWVALTAREAGAMTSAQTTAAVAIMMSGIAIYGMLVVRAAAWSRARFDPESTRRLWGWPLTRLTRPPR